MRCPRGWFLQRIMKAEAPYRERTVKGRTAHSLIETADRDGIEAARAQWKQSQDDENTMEIVERAWKKYCSDWTHGGVRHQEVTMTLTLDSGHQIKGRADRVDEREDGVLVIDWKLRSKVNPTDSEFRQSQLQRYLYPQMAAETYKKPALGMLYVSLQHNRHEGSTVGDLGLGDSVNPHWKEESEVALKRVETAIGEIEEGHWWRKGESCPEWCSCKLEEQIKSS
jgi:ATP-dependent helicase/DNAse subunit B